MKINKLIIDSSDSITDLCKLGVKYPTDKSPYVVHDGHRHPYMAVYDMLFMSLRYKPIKFAEGGIVTGTTYNATIGEAGPEAIVPLDKFNAFIDNMLKSNGELIAAVKQGGNVYIDNRMAGTATALGTYKI